MKKFLKYLVIVLVVGVGSLFVIPQARANFIGSVGEIISSLRGVEEEAVNVFVPSPPEPEISLGNSESEALTAEQVLFEESITSLSAVGSCDDSVGEENRSFAQRIANDDFNFASSGLENFNINNFQNLANDISIEFSNESAFIRTKIKRPTDADYVYKIFVNGNDITLTDFTNTNEILFDKNSKDLNLNLTYQKILQSIEDVGFATSANIFSISDTAKIGGKVGWVKETSLSKEIQKKIANLEKDQVSKPIKINENFLILRIDDIKLNKQKIDKNKILSNRISYKKNQQLERFSLAFFNKVKQNTQIYEY